MYLLTSASTNGFISLHVYYYYLALVQSPLTVAFPLFSVYVSQLAFRLNNYFLATFDP